MDRLRAQERRVGDLHLLAVRTAIVISGDAVASCRDAGHDRDVVGVGERWYLRAAERIRASAVECLGDARHQPPAERVVHIFGVPAVGADCEDWP